MVAVNYLWNPLNDNIVREYDDAGAAVAEYTTEPDTFGNLVSQDVNFEPGYFHFDGSGSTLALTSASGVTSDKRAYTAFGEPIEEAGTSFFPFQYIGRQGYYRDTAIMHAVSVRRRDYSAGVGRWLSADPFLFLKDKATYVYASNQPTIKLDPSGLAAPAIGACVVIGLCAGCATVLSAVVFSSYLECHDECFPPKFIWVKIGDQKYPFPDPVQAALCRQCMEKDLENVWRFMPEWRKAIFVAACGGGCLGVAVRIAS